MTVINSPLGDALRDRYLLERELGRGGMATVYLARDLRHDRLVALKVLHQELAHALGPERFVQEIKVAARLQHPHLLPVFDSGTAKLPGSTVESLWFTMPYVAGESLRQRLARESQLPLRDAVSITLEVADALGYAHGQGIVHRDVKPENILLSGDHCVIADFGVARALDAAGGERVTETGITFGTPLYMSPEQASADRQLDGRSDIYSLGCVLYEMLAGEPPFTGRTAQAILARRLSEPVPHLRTLRDVPEGIEEVVSRALARSPADRFVDTSQFAQALQAAIGSQPAVPTQLARAARRPAFRRRILLAGTGALAAVAVLLGLYRGLLRAPDGPRQTQLTFVGNVERQEVSPDRQLLAYVERGDSLRVFVTDLTGNSVIPIATFSDITTLRWSPDGTTILCVGAVNDVRLVAALYPRLGGTPRLLPWTGPNNALSADQARLVSWHSSTGPGMVITTLTTGTRRSIRLPENLGWLFEGDWSPDGRWIALLSRSKTGKDWTVRAIDLDTGVKREVLSDSVPLSAPRWSPAGDALYYLRDHNELRKIAITPEGVPRGAPEVLQTGLGATRFSITADGTALVYTKEQRQSNLWHATASGAHAGAHAGFSTTQLTRGTTEKTPGRLSPDGRLIAFIQKESGRADVYVIRAEGGAPRRITSSGTANVDGSLGPAWSPDGRYLAFLSTVQGHNRVHTTALEGGHERIYERTEASFEGDLAWAPHKRILYQRPGNRNFHWLDLETESEQPLVANDSVGWMDYALPSSNRRYVAVGWNRRRDNTLAFGTYVISLHDNSQAPVGPRYARPIGWSAGNTSVFVQDIAGEEIRRVPLHGGEGAMVGINPFKDALCSLTERTPGLVLLCKVDYSISDVWLVENFDPTIFRRSSAR